MNDPVRARRAQIGRLAARARAAGWALFGVATLVFVAGMIVGLSDVVTMVVMACLIVGSVLLAPAIIVGYGVRAAEREDRGA